MLTLMEIVVFLAFFSSEYLAFECKNNQRWSSTLKDVCNFSDVGNKSLKKWYTIFSKKFSVVNL